MDNLSNVFLPQLEMLPNYIILFFIGCLMLMTYDRFFGITLVAPLVHVYTRIYDTKFFFIEFVLGLIATFALSWFMYYIIERKTNKKYDFKKINIIFTVVFYCFLKIIIP